MDASPISQAQAQVVTPSPRSDEQKKDSSGRKIFGSNVRVIAVHSVNPRVNRLNDKTFRHRLCGALGKVRQDPPPPLRDAGHQKAS